jgi:hypothetical protein
MNVAIFFCCAGYRGTKAGANPMKRFTVSYKYF